MKIKETKFIKVNSSKNTILGIVEMVVTDFKPTDEFTIRFKLTEGKDGHSFFPSMASYCVDEMNKIYADSFETDSKSIDNSLKDRAREIFKQYNQRASTQSQSVFDKKTQEIENEDPVPF